ncbi:hypothetical protein J6590_032260 [Homalodisca vitripennis]|nr:hypothetical protein J6590_032260 [Homalodisca vitripennis]
MKEVKCRQEYDGGIRSIASTNLHTTEVKRDRTVKEFLNCSATSIPSYQTLDNTPFHGGVGYRSSLPGFIYGLDKTEE